MITANDFRSALDAIRAAGYGEDVDWSENVAEPQDPDEFAREAIYVICNSGMRFTVARGIFNRVMANIEAGKSATGAFGHVGKATAIDAIWNHRAELLDQYRAAEDKLAFCERLPWIGPTTKYHLAKNFGAQVAKPDVHLQRLADREGCSAQQLCERLAGETGFKVPTIDSVLWRACAIGVIDSKAMA